VEQRVPPAETAVITYRFHLARGVEEIVLRFDAQSFQLLRDDSAQPKEWARLDFQQCPHCPLTPAQSPLCPFADPLSDFIEGFDEFWSYETAVIEIITATRTVVGHKPLQHGMASLIGLIGATSGCPHLAFFRPMARFHLPFARDDETLYRVFSMHLLEAYLKGEPLTDATWQGLRERNHAATQVNRAMVKRIRAAFHKDVVLNALIVLDSFAQSVPYVIEDRLDELRQMFGLPVAKDK
jgi:hypothetical protein